MNIGEQLKLRRKELNISQSQMAERLGVTQSYIADLERGRKRPSIQTLEPFITELGGELKIIWTPKGSR